MPAGILDINALKSQSQTGAASRSVGDNELASKQMENLTGKDSVMRQRSEAAGKNYANSRGLLNSSIGAESAFGAFVDRAAPIAMADADRYGRTADQNLAYENQFKMSDKNFGQQGLLQKDNQAWQTGERQGAQTFSAGENALDRTLQKDLQGNEFTWRSGENSADRNLQKDLQGNEFTWRSGEAGKDRDLTREQSAADRALTMNENEKNRVLEQYLQSTDQSWRSGENAQDRILTMSEAEKNRLLEQALQQGDQSWRSGEASLDRQQQSSLLDRQQQFAAGENALDRNLSREEIDSRERTAVEQSKAELEKLGYALKLDQMQLNASTQNQMNMMLLSQIMQIQNNGDLTPESKEAAIKNAMDTVTNLAKTVSEVNNFDVAQDSQFDRDRASQVMVDEANRNGFTNASTADLAYALDYARQNNLTEQEMRAFVREELAKSQVPNAQNTPDTQALIDLAAKYGYQATAAEAEEVARYAAQNNLSPSEVVMMELRARGLA